MRRGVRLGIVGGAVVALVATGIVVTRSTGQAAACADSWNGGSGDFNTPTSWSTGAVPTSTDDACITAAGTYTVTLNGSVSIRSLSLGGASGTQTLVLAANGEQLNLSAASSINANGVLTMGDTGSGSASVGTAGVTLPNSGHLNTVAGAGGSRFLHTDLINAASGTIDLAGPTIQDGGGGGSTATTNSGAITVEPAGSLTVGGAISSESFRNSAGSMTNNGSITMANFATFIQRGGSVSGAPVAFNNGSTLDDDTTAAAASFHVGPDGMTLTGRR